jgi:radical SAM-linked protein
MKLAFASALAVGVTSEAEYADFEITDDNMAPSEFMTRLNEQLPKGLEILAAKPRASKQNIMATISASEYYVLAGVDKACNEKVLKSGIRDLLAKNEIMVEKKTKSGVKNTDIRNMIFDLSFELQEADSFNLVKLNMLVSAGSKANLKPDLLTEALFNNLGFEYDIEKIHRTKLFVEAREQVLDPMDPTVL